VAFRSLNAPTNKISETKKMLCPAQSLESNDSANLTLLRLKLQMTFHKIDLKQKISRTNKKKTSKGFSFETKTKRKLFQTKHTIHNNFLLTLIRLCIIIARKHNPQPSNVLQWFLPSNSQNSIFQETWFLCRSILVTITLTTATANSSTTLTSKLSH
jgi:hypothetical protein